MLQELCLFLNQSLFELYLFRIRFDSVGNSASEYFDFLNKKIDVIRT